LFTCASLLRRLPECKFDVFDASPVPFGLVRYGVAPDHQELSFFTMDYVKNCTNLFDRMFESNRDRLSLFCNVKVGSDVAINELTRHYDAILLAYGAHRPRRLDIPGARSRNVISGSDFVSWYNGVPNAKAPLLDDPNVVIVGNGNVALDCARILSTVKSLRTTDVPSEVLALLEKSNVTHIQILGRRGPEDVSFTIKELREQFKVRDWNTTVEMDDEEVQQLKEALPTMERRKKRLMSVLLSGVGDPHGERQCRFLNFRVPKEIIPGENGRISAVRILNKRTGNEEELPCGLLIYSIGYQTMVLEGIPKNDKGMIAMKDSSRVDMPCGSFVYAAGWCAHGPRGVIVDTQQEAVVVADRIAKDIMARKDVTGSLRGVQSILDARRVNYITWDEWKKIDELEVKQGAMKGKVREKLTKFNSLCN
uniref:NADPH:adrenodoxin oxidoreductase, mitochondrial n=1 Tax=Heligmosomoides polygyrus TaxID=6339 RepID=A0A183GIX9_HELPZ